ncbi:hypothetical protein LF1_40040 [Rubripirellula obstinata]|uniref:Uncharacterized protein n=3 Tax=Rubripirellula obstinata TaxID=406547 RepID=A0A5B1CQF2_9BACT|nr:hypothetical protein LF1_40040 [Rubripirellula obstinata]
MDFAHFINLAIKTRRTSTIKEARMADKTNPQIEETLDQLAELVCRSLSGEENQLTERRDGLLKTLVMSGYVWKADETVMQQVEERVKNQCVEPSMHRGGALSSMTSKLNTRFQEISRWESKTPTESKSMENDSPPKAANISSATDA